MRELLWVFVIALVLGSIINDLQQKPKTAPPPAVNAQSHEISSADANTPRHDFPDFASYTNVSADNFEQTVLKSPKPVFVDCYIPNNQACDQMVPLVAAVGKKHEDSLVLAKLNIMDNVLLAHRYEIASVPTFLLFEHGELVGKLSGVFPQDRLESMLSTLRSASLGKGSEAL